MAEAVIFGIAGKIVDFLVPQALEKVGNLWGVKHELEELRKTVTTLRAVLEDAEQRSYHSPQIKDWLDNMKDALYDAEDVLEEFHIEAMRRELRGHNEMTKEVRTFFSGSNQLAFKLKMSYKVKAVREKIKAVNDGRQFHLDVRPVDSRVERVWGNREETHSFVHDVDIKGRDADKATVREFLLDLDVKENVSILPIVGIGGLGKTALAQCVYNDEMVSKHFHLKMWVCVSNDFDMKKLVTNIIASAKNTAPSGVAMDQLQSELRAEIEGKRYLLVLDDFWDEDPEKWRPLKDLLVGGAKGSKILITTRLPLVADITGTASYHLLGDLSESASVDLLMHIACPKEEEIHDPEKRAIAKEIARKCYGVPLVVRTVGSLLFFKKSKQEWLHFKDHELPKVSQKKEDCINSTLRLSYDRLPSHLKQCFALCSLFPKDYEIKKWTLVDLWMAEGFIQPLDRSQHLENVAHGYFMDLLWRNFFQDFKKDPVTNVETCKMHDLMHDLACMVARTECWVTWDDTKSIHERTRHLSHDSASNLMDKLLISPLKANALRTILSTREYWGIVHESMSEANLRQLIHSFKRLRILDLHTTSFEKVPRSICKLKHLTYLDLSHNHGLRKLPNAVTRLQNLQTLNLYGCRSLEELPRDIRKLVCLRNLDIDGCGRLSYVPRGLGQLSSLCRLTRFILPQNKTLAKSGCKLGELNGLNNIQGGLCIENLGSVTSDAAAESNAANLTGKRSLKSLTLKWGNFGTNYATTRDSDEVLLDGLQPPSNIHKLILDGYKGERFPRWMMDSLVSSLPNLVELRLYGCPRCRRLPQLGQLPRLKTLEIQGMTELECIESDYSTTSTASSFPSLLTLHIDHCGKLKTMPLASHLEELMLSDVHAALINQMVVGLNKLKSLDIRRIEFLERLLDEERLKGLTSLESLSIWRCPRLTSLSSSLGMRYLSSVKDLSISDCPVLNISKDERGNIISLDDSHGGGLVHSLRSLIIGCLPKLESIPRWLLQLTNLEYLTIYGCDNLKELPEQMEALQSLQRLHIQWCPSLTSLPEGMRRLASLTHLYIVDCPELEERCKRDVGEHWYKIAHIPHIYM